MEGWFGQVLSIPLRALFSSPLPAAVKLAEDLPLGSSHYHYENHYHAVVEVVLGSGHYQDVELLLLSTGHQPLPAAASTLMHDTCPAQTEAHSPHVISFALFTTCYLFWFYSLHAMSPTLTHIYYLFSLHFALFTNCYHLVRLLLPVSKSHRNFIFHAEFLLKTSTVSN